MNLMRILILAAVTPLLAVLPTPAAPPAEDGFFPFLLRATPNDFDGDRLSDLAMYEAATGRWTIRQSHNDAELAMAWGWSETRPVPGDYDGDGVTDLAVYHRRAGTWYIRDSHTGNLRILGWGMESARPVPGDYNGDGLADPAVYDQDRGVWYVLRGTAAWVFSFGWRDARAVQADYDGDGVTDPAVFYRPTGTWFIFQSASGQLRQVNFGWRDTRPVPADYDGDGAADLAVYDHATGAWYILGSASGALRTASFGFAEAHPVPGDYDGDGVTDLAVHHRRSGTWYVAPSSGGAMRAIAWGGTAATPLAAYANGGMEGLIFLAFGDSITYGTSSSANGPATGYPKLLEHFLEPVLGGHFLSINAGNPGEDTSEGIRRFNSVIRAYMPDLLMLMEGTNDGFYQFPYGTTESNLRGMINTALGYGIPVILATIPPVISNSGHDRSAQMAWIQGFNPTIYRIASSYNIPVAQVYEAITSQPNWQRNLIDQATANHPNDAGYQFVRQAFYEALRSAYDRGLYY
jgi:lysophospholipase L1-like esterase